MIKILHHGGTHGVTGSCHELVYHQARSVLIDCGLFQGDDHSSHGSHSAHADQLAIDFDLSHVQALIVTHAHIDHMGRIPYLFAAGFKGKLYCSEATATLLPIMLEDALKMGFTRNQRLVEKTLAVIESHIQPLPYSQWIALDSHLKIKVKPAGHILGSAYVECAIKQGTWRDAYRVVFSGDLGAPYAPLLPSPKSPYRCDTLVLESTYGDKDHTERKSRRHTLKRIIEHCMRNDGTVLIPAFSLGRTQELLYELEQLIHQYQKHPLWQQIEVIVDSPLAQRFTAAYRTLKRYWDKEAKRKVKAGRHPLDFEQLYTVQSHEEHVDCVTYLQKTARPAIVIAGSGMCNGGRIVNYLKALIENERTDILFTGYQAQGTVGRSIQKYGDKTRYDQGWVELDGQRLNIHAQVHTISGYSAHAGQENLLNFVKRMRYKPDDIRLVHGDQSAKQILRQKLASLVPQADISIPALGALPLSGWVKKQIIQTIIESEHNVVAIYLYGSRAKQVAHDDSDWDVALIFTEFESDKKRRVLRPQRVQQVLEKTLQLYGQISVVDIEAVPLALQYNAIQGITWYDNGDSRIRRLENAILSRYEHDIDR